MFTYKDLRAWQLSMDVAEACYKATDSFPASELYGLTGQIRRASVSIPSNIAEGQCRKSTKAYVNHLNIALGSHGELDTLLILAGRLGFLTSAKRDALSSRLQEIGRLVNGLRRSLKKKILARRATRVRAAP